MRRPCGRSPLPCPVPFALSASRPRQRRAVLFGSCTTCCVWQQEPRVKVGGRDTSALVGSRPTCRALAPVLLSTLPLVLRPECSVGTLCEHSPRARRGQKVFHDARWPKHRPRQRPAHTKQQSWTRLWTRRGARVPRSSSAERVDLARPRLCSKLYLQLAALATCEHQQLDLTLPQTVLARKRNNPQMERASSWRRERAGKARSSHWENGMSGTLWFLGWSIRKRKLQMRLPV